MIAVLTRAKDAPQIPCECGCGILIDAWDMHGRRRRYERAHQTKSHVRRKNGISGGRKSLKILMTLRRAREIAGTLSRTTKMPGYSYGLDAFSCIKGSELAEDPNSTCHDCFARRDLYLWKATREAHATRMDAIDHPDWEDAMIELISHHCREERWFRWHDSGDVMSTTHLLRILRVVKGTPAVQHWLPTREYGFVEWALGIGAMIPSNLVIRLSAYMVDEQPGVPDGISHLPTSTVHTGDYPVPIGRRRDSVVCRAMYRDNKCGGCRACWSPKVKNVSYPRH